jgi:hypothetical protein
VHQALPQKLVAIFIPAIVTGESIVPPFASFCACCAAVARRVATFT